MMVIVLAVFYATLGLVVVSLVWRLASQHHALPCPAWLAGLVERDNPLATAHRARNLISAAGLRPGMVALDAGCGPGRVTIPLADAVGPQGGVVALDLQEAMLERVRSKAGARDWIAYQNARLGAGTLAPEMFDRAFLIAVLGEIPEPQAALGDIYQALKVGGTLTVAELIFDPHFQRKAKVMKLAHEAGFELLQESGRWYAYSLVFVRRSPSGSKALRAW